MRRIWKVLAIIALSMGLVAALAVALIWGAVVEPWPLSRRQGPDTAYARQMYRYLLNKETPAGVRDIYAREEWGFGGDSIYSLRFGFADAETLDEILRGAAWVRVTPGNLARLRYLNGPGWWPKEADLRLLTQAYTNGQVEVLWVDSANETLYFQRANFCCVLPQLHTPD